MEKKKTNIQIATFINKVSLVDFQDNINDTYPNKKGEIVISDKVLLIVNKYGGGNHKEKYASYYIKREDALYLAHHIVNRKFGTEVYNDYKGQKHHGVYMTFAGDSIARVFSLKYLDKKDKSGNIVGKKYEVKVGLYKPVKGDKGQTSPDWKNKIDEHSCEVGEEEMIKMMLSLQQFIQSSMTVRIMQQQMSAMFQPSSTPAPVKQEEAPKQEEKKQTLPPQDPKYLEIRDEDLPF